MVEYIISVDEEDKKLGPIEKMEAHKNGTLHRAFSILVFNSRNQLLLQKRAKGKYHSPGLWTNTCCSHPRFGESLIHAVNRRLKEEMGFTCELEEIYSFKYRVKFQNNLIENEYDHVFAGKYDGNVEINKEEVEEYKWVSLDELKIDIKNNPDLYTYWFKVLFDEMGMKLFKFLEEIN